MRPYAIDASVAGRIGFGDIMLSTLISFLITPVCLALCGLLIMSVDERTVLELSLPAEILFVIAYSGFFAWMAAPIAVLGAWIAKRLGWIGWAYAPTLGGGIAGVFCFLAFLQETVSTGDFRPLLGITALFAAFGAGYGMLFWLGIRYLRPDAFGKRAV